MEYTPKDEKRILDLIKKGEESKFAMLNAAMKQAKLITQADKAIGRARVAAKYKESELVMIFMTRYDELTFLDVQKQFVELKKKEEVKAFTKEKGNIYFNKGSLAALWNWELTGQFSDGMWENTRPYDHWKIWSNLTVKEGPNVIGFPYHPMKDNYNLHGLIPINGDRMLAYGRMGKAIGVEGVLKLGCEVRCIIEDFPSEVFDLKEFKEKMIAMYSYRNDEYYWKGLTQEMVNAFYEVTYTSKEMNGDLKTIKGMMKNFS